MIKIAIGLIAISTLLMILYMLGRITIRITHPDTQHPTFEQTALAAMMGVLVLGLFSLVVCLMYIVGSIIMNSIAI